MLSLLDEDSFEDSSGVQDENQDLKIDDYMGPLSDSSLGKHLQFSTFLISS